MDKNNLQKLHAVFMGTPRFAAIILKQILAHDLLEISAVYCQPDRPAGRGGQIRHGEVKQLALAHSMPVEQPTSFTSDSVCQILRSYQPDVLLVAAYGLILPQAVLNIPRLMPLNVHASLLPRYRGAAPVQQAIMQGEKVSGVSIMRMEAELDAGPILMQRAMAIGINDTASMLLDELALEGAVLLIEALDRLRHGTLCQIEQDSLHASYAPKLRKEASILDLRHTCLSIHARLRALTPWPGGNLTLLRPGLDPLPVRVFPGNLPIPKEATTLYEQTPNTSPGNILGIVDKTLLVACADSVYPFPYLQPAGKNKMDGQSFYNGYLKNIPEPQFSLPA